MALKQAGVAPGRLEVDADGTPFSPAFGDLYHPMYGALAQARHVFLGGNGLPSRWQGRDRFVVLETGFGLGSNFLATWLAWLADPQRCDRLHVISIEAHPLSREDLASIVREPAIAALAEELVAAWPPATRNLHRLSFSAGRVELLLLFDDVRSALPQLRATVDAFYLDGFSPARNPAMWEPRLFKAMARIAAKGATASTWSVAGAVDNGLRAAGFETRQVRGIGGKREITFATFSPRFAPRPSWSVASPTVHGRDAPVVIVGAGVAGCAVAWALAEQGIASILLERRASIAEEGSGQAAGLFHGVVHGDDGHHARFNRAAALEVRQHVLIAVARHGVRGSAAGLLRLDPEASGVDAMRAMLEHHALPADYVRVLDADAASLVAGAPLRSPAWHFPGGGWIEPRGLSRSFIERCEGLAQVRLNTDAAALRRIDGGWHVLDAEGHLLQAASAIVLANAGEAPRLIGNAEWPMERRRGQLSGIATRLWPQAGRLRLPVAGAGYLLPGLDGTTWFGATSNADDGDLQVRTTDHAANLERLGALVGGVPPIETGALVGRVGFRWSSADRLPIVGAVPLSSVDADGLGLLDRDASSPRPEHPRFAPRVPGLFVVTALGSRGIAWSTLAARCVVSAITGAPAPLEAELLDAIDPARFASRAWRLAQAAAGRTAQPPVGPIDAGSTGS